MRFYVYKRALMLTAATIALLSGPAEAATHHTVGTSEKKPLTTTKDGNITFPANGSLAIPSSTNTTVPSAITFDAAAPHTVTMTAGSKLTYKDTTEAVGIQAVPGAAGEAILGGTIDLTGKGTAKTGILIGKTTATTGTFTGIVDGTNNTIDGAVSTAIVLQSGSLLEVQGDGSEGIYLQPNVTVVGDIVSFGTIEMLPSTANSTSSSGVTGIELAGTTNGSLIVGAGGLVESFGQGARGIVVGGAVNGAIQNFGTIFVSGTQSTATTDTGNPVPGSALIVSGNVTHGIYNAGPLTYSDGSTAASSISTSGASPALLITTGYLGTSTLLPVTIGGFAESGGSTYSLFNRGSISSTTQNIDVSSTAVQIAGSSGDLVTLSSGIYNSGTISAQSTGDTNGSGTTTASALVIGSYTKINEVGGFAITNSANGAPSSSSQGTGTISAQYSGTAPGAAYAVSIAQNANVTSLSNEGTIKAVAATTDTKIASLSAYGILDQSGTLVDITNSGSITAQAYANVNGTITALDNNQNVAFAIDVGDAAHAVTLTNTGVITGDIRLGEHNNIITVTGTGTADASITGNILLGGGQDTLTVNNHATVAGDLLEVSGGRVNITVAQGGTLTVKNNGSTSNGQTIPNNYSKNLPVNVLTVKDGGTLGITLGDGFNINNQTNAGPVVQANTNIATPGTITLESQATLNVNFGGYVTATNSTGTAKFVVFDALTNELVINNSSQVKQALTGGIPFLYSGSVCAYGDATLTGSFGSCGAPSTNPEGAGHDDVILTLKPKTAKDLGLTGYAKQMFAFANEALANDPNLGAAVINAGIGIDGTTKKGLAQGQQTYQQIYSGFAPDVSGSARAIAISLTDQASSIVGDRQRKLRMYAGQDGDITLWAQEFGQRLSVPNRSTAGGYNNSGFGIAMGMDGGSISSGRYGGAFTFYAGDTSEKAPRDSKTSSQWYMLTGYSDWRGKHLFFDSNVNIAYGHLDGKRTLSIDDLSGTTLITRSAEGKRASALASGGFSTGMIFNSGGTVFAPQFSMDALTLREEGYTESGGGPGMDLRVQPYYASSLRAFLGADLRQDLKMGSFFLQPELRAGYRYDLVSGQEKLKINFAGDQQVTPTVAPGSEFTITGPDPAKGNLVLGAGLAVTTDAWSIGVNYDYIRGFGGTKGINQDAMLTLIGRI